MGPIAYSLCQKPVIGVVMFITSLCVFPPLFENEPIPLMQADTKVVKAFKVSVAKKYFVELTFRFPSAKERLDDQLVRAMVDRNCVENESGRTALFRVTVRRSPGQSIVSQQTFSSLCGQGYTTTDQLERIGSVELDQGNYTLELTNLQAHPGLERVEAQVSLVAGHGK